MRVDTLDGVSRSIYKHVYIMESSDDWEDANNWDRIEIIVPNISDMSEAAVLVTLRLILSA